MAVTAETVALRLHTHNVTNKQQSLGVRRAGACVGRYGVDAPLCH